VPEVDVDRIFERSAVTLAPSERDDERNVRLIKEKRGALFEDIRNISLFFIIVICLLVLGGLCVKLVFFDKDATAETQKWAETVLTALASGGAAFLFGRALPSKK